MAEIRLRQANVEGTKAEAEERLAQRVPDFYRGRCVLVTGGSGFVGRVLLEKLLRCCPDVDTVFLLLRTRKGVSPHDRLKALTDVPLFDRLRAEQPGALSKVKVVAGDSAQSNLGLSPADAQLLRERVSVVFHLAASVRFDDPILTALHTNVRSTRELLDLATQMPLLKAFVHVSTTFCNVDQEVYEEKLYAPPADGRTLLEAAETLDPYHLRALTNKILGQHGNTYTFTKNLAEHLLTEYKDRLPLGILRPSVVLCTMCDPIPGWIDNLNGPVGLFVGAGKGIVHAGYADSEMFLDFLPCDTIVKGLLISSCEIAKKGVGDISVYQGAQSEIERFKQKELVSIGYELAEKLPFKESLYHPCGFMTKNFWLYYVLFVFFHLIPAVLVDAGLSFAGKKPMLLRLQRRILAANMAVSYFSMRNWNFVNQRFLSLEKNLAKGDQEDFAFNLHHFNPRDMYVTAALGVRRYMLNESDDDLPLARRQYQRKRLIHIFLKTLFYFSLMWFVLSRVFRVIHSN